MRPIYVIVALAAGATGARLLWPSDGPSSSPRPVAAASETVAPERVESHRFANRADDAADVPLAARTSHVAGTRMPAGPRETPAEMRTRVTARLVASGDAPAPFHADVEDLVEGWQRDLPSTLRGHVEIGAASCHRDGCAVEIVSENAIAHEETNATLADAPAFVNYAGWRMRSGDETDSLGRVHATWFFLAPSS